MFDEIARFQGCSLSTTYRRYQTGLADVRHVAGGPSPINGLVGIAIASTMLMHVEELIA